MCMVANEHKIDKEFFCAEPAELIDFEVVGDYKNKFHGYVQNLCQRTHDKLPDELNDTDLTLSFPDNIFFAPDLEKPIIDFLSLLETS